MRFLAGLCFGSLGATAATVLMANTVFKPAVETYPEFRQVTHRAVKAETERDESRRAAQLANIEADLLRVKLHVAEQRCLPGAVNPAGVDVPAADRIPAPAVPFPTGPAPRRD